MTTTFLEKVHRNAKGVPVAETRTLRTKADVSALSYYTICAIADTLNNPFAMVQSGEVLVVDLDARGNFLRVESLGRTLPVDGVQALVPLCACPKCGKDAIVALTPAQRLAQPDDTTHVCHPGLGGCNHGFTDSRSR